MRMERHTCPPETTLTYNPAETSFLMLRVMAKFDIKEYCNMLIYHECGRRVKSASRLYRERFPEGRHPARQTILKVVKRLRETGCVTSRPRVRKPSNVGRKVQPEDVLAYALAHPQSNSPGPILAINMGSTRLIGLLFYEGTLTGQRYLELLQDVITECVENLLFHQLRNVWFQHDGAPPHKISNAKQYLMETFQNEFIGYDGLVEWPPRSPDLNLLGFFLWGHIKGQVYANLPPTLQDLRRRITNACTTVTPAMLHNLQHEIQSRVQMRIVANGEHFDQCK
ncbi:hypothetical protein AVEN_17083-1 [Araneus ventricosus]|uniref:DUF4817 domain-containing protein n=1 Tax=Araneus ventricosus TaxID=182803 RepID=A0A4Y2VF29_ARAVE|nr:hypothetical protein AVEN_17083-1 [Araneus ventricosus]